MSVGDPPTYLMNPVVMEMIRQQQRVRDSYLAGAFPLSLFEPQIIADEFVPAKQTREVIDDCDPFIDYEGDFKMAKANGFTKQETYTPVYAFRTPSVFDMPFMHQPRYLLSSFSY